MERLRVRPTTGEKKGPPHCPWCGRAMGKGAMPRQLRTGHCTDECRLHHALRELNRSRRTQFESAARTPLWASACYWSTIVAIAAIFVGYGLSALSPGGGELVLGLAVLGCLTVWILAACYHGVRVAGIAALLLWRIPVVLFFHARMHLLELLLIVALLGNGAGLLVAHGSDNDRVTTTSLCALWVTMVLGGAAWGLWACTVLELRQALARCTLVLTGVLSPAAVVGLCAGPIWLTAGLADLFVRAVDGLLLIGLGLSVGALSFFILRHACRHHTRAWNVAATERTRRRREERRKRREEAIAALVRSMDAEAQRP